MYLLSFLIVFKAAATVDDLCCNSSLQRHTSRVCQSPLAEMIRHQTLIKNQTPPHRSFANDTFFVLEFLQGRGREKKFRISPSKAHHDQDSPNVIVPGQ
jgi:hypothetical protein